MIFKSNHIAIGGPTASGKSSLAMAVAMRVGGEIVSCDSMQIYKYLDVGTAKPTAKERQFIPHHMVDFLEPEKEFSVAEFLDLARGKIEDIESRGKIAILCGGSGMYMNDLLGGADYSKEAAVDYSLRNSIKAEYKEYGPQKLLDEIAAANPRHAARLSPSDEKRIVRALELLRTTGSTYSMEDMGKKPELVLNAASFYIVYSDRQKLYDRINHRVDIMVKNGLLDEAKMVYDNRFTYKTAAAAIGYKEWFGYFEGSESYDDCLEKLKQASRNYAKRQLTWFRNRGDMFALDASVLSFDDMVELVTEVWQYGNAKK